MINCTPWDKFQSNSTLRAYENREIWSSISSLRTPTMMMVCDSDRSRLMTSGSYTFNSWLVTAVNLALFIDISCQLNFLRSFAFVEKFPFIDVKIDRKDFKFALFFLLRELLRDELAMFKGQPWNACLNLLILKYE